MKRSHRINRFTARVTATKLAAVSLGILGLIPCVGYADNKPDLGMDTPKEPSIGVDTPSEPSINVDHPNYAAPLDSPVNNNVQPATPPDSTITTKDDIIVPVPHEKSRYPELVDEKYVGILSQWAFQLTGSPSALGGNTVTSGPKTRGIGVNLEFQPKAFQWSFGTLSFGPQTYVYPFVTSTTNAPATIPVWSIGADLRYKLLFTGHQLLVPMVGYSYEHVSYHLADAGDGSLSLAGPIVGGEILLSEVDTMSSDDLYVLTGITRVYLVTEARILSGSDENLSLSGTSFYFGLRLEF